MRILLILVTALLLAACGGGDKLHYTQEGVTPRPEPKVDGEDFLVRAWRHNLDGQFSAHAGRLRPGVDGELVFLAGPGGEVSALDLASGALRWEVDLDRPLFGGVGAGDGLVVVSGADGTVIALGREDGSEAWRSRVGGEVLAAAAISPGVAVIRAGDSKLAGLDTADGTLLWTVQKAVEGLTVRGLSQPLLNGRGAVAGLADGRLLAVDIDRGRVLWETPIGTRRGNNEVGRLADIDSDPALLGTVLYVASYQSRVVAMALGSPRVIWSADVSTLKNLGLDADHLYVTTDTGAVVALNRFTGERVWEQDQLTGRGLTGPAVLGDALVVGDYEGVVYRLDPASGAILAAQDISGSAVIDNPVVVDDLLLLVTEDGRVHAMRRR